MNFCSKFFFINFRNNTINEFSSDGTPRKALQQNIQGLAVDELRLLERGI